MSFNLEIISPQKIFFNDEIDLCILPGVEGDFGILKNHMPFLTTLRIGIAYVYKNKKLIVNLALNYGSKSELKNAFNKLKKKNSNITDSQIRENLYTKKLPDPDILIRTGGQKRLSNFMLWQLAYSELYFLDKLWPDFNSNDLKKIIKNYRLIKRNFGNI